MIFTRILTSAFTTRRLSLVQDLRATLLVIDVKKIRINCNKIIILFSNSFATSNFCIKSIEIVYKYDITIRKKYYKNIKLKIFNYRYIRICYNIPNYIGGGKINDKNSNKIVKSRSGSESFLLMADMV